MICPKCTGKIGVIETCTTKDVIHRRRKCKECGYTFHTAEKIVPYDYVAAAAWSYKDQKYKYKKEQEE